MGGIIIAMPRIEDAKKIGDILVSHGIQTVETCTTGNAVLQKAHQLDSGVVICSRNLKDMYFSQLQDNLPDYYEMILLASRDRLDECPEDIIKIGLPFRKSELINTVESILAELDRKTRKKKTPPKRRSKEEQQLIDKAKVILMKKNDMTEPEAFRYIQKNSMDSSTSMVETAQKILQWQID